MLLNRCFANGRNSGGSKQETPRNCTLVTLFGEKHRDGKARYSKVGKSPTFVFPSACPSTAMLLYCQLDRPYCTPVPDHGFSPSKLHPSIKILRYLTALFPINTYSSSSSSLFLNQP